MRTKLMAVVMSVVAISALMGSAAFTTATLTRDVNVPVVADNNGGIVAMQEDAQGGVLSVNQTGSANGGSVEFDFSNVSDGANVNAEFEFGDNSSAQNANDAPELASNATLNITNNDNTARTFSLTLENFDTPTSVDGDEVKFVFYNASDQNTGIDGNAEVVITNSGNTKTVDVQPGGTLQTVIIVDTRGIDKSNLDGNDLNGRLNVTAT